ncbi:MAG: HisA/HisF-related TIM barrel protein [Rhodospirillales bacterium]|nr:HisA/HisF-related TIM barrel protein [Rhodospirillales bacterium]
MDVIPVIDLKAGQVVHARGGQRDAYRPIATPLSPTSAPADVLAGLLRLHPFRRLYVADLDAIEGRGSHAALLAGLAAAHPGLEIWLDAGLRDAATVAAMLAAGLTPVLGSESQDDTALLHRFRDDPRVVLSLDFRGASFQGPAAILADAALWPRRVIAMTLASVGAAAGPDVARVAELRERVPDRAVYAAGGVRNAEDLRALATIGAAGALVASALHAGTLGGAELAAASK